MASTLCNYLPEVLCRFPEIDDTVMRVARKSIDDSFKGMNRVQQQRAVYASLKGKMDGAHGEFHALALTTKAPE